MRLTFLGKSTQGGGSPTLYATDHDTYVVQGWRVTGEPESCVEIPASLLEHLLPGTLDQMIVPDHEVCIEVGKLRKDA